MLKFLSWLVWGKLAKHTLKPEEHLVASVTETIQFTSEGKKDGSPHAITFTLFQKGSARRYEVHQTSTCDRNDAHKHFWGPILVWVGGGPLPADAVSYDYPTKKTEHTFDWHKLCGL